MELDSPSNISIAPQGAERSSQIAAPMLELPSSKPTQITLSKSLQQERFEALDQAMLRRKSSTPVLAGTSTNPQELEFLGQFLDKTLPKTLPFGSGLGLFFIKSLDGTLPRLDRGRNGGSILVPGRSGVLLIIHGSCWVLHLETLD